METALAQRPCCSSLAQQQARAALWRLLYQSVCCSSLAQYLVCRRLTNRESAQRVRHKGKESLQVAMSQVPLLTLSAFRQVTAVASEGCMAVLRLLRLGSIGARVSYCSKSAPD